MTYLHTETTAFLMILPILLVKGVALFAIVYFAVRLALRNHARAR